MRFFRFKLLIFGLFPLLLYAQKENTVLFPFECENDSSVDCAVILNKIISDGKTPLVISFEAGNYFFRSTVKLKSNVVIQGSKTEKTNFIFDLKGKNDLIEIKGSISKQKIHLFEDVENGDFEVVVPNVNMFEIGMMVRIFKSQPVLELSNWASQSVGQLMEVAQVSDSSIKFTRAVRLNYTILDIPKLEIVKPVENVKLTNLIIERKDQSLYQTSNINLVYARNCVLDNIVSVMTNFAHVSIDYSMNVRVEKFDAYNSFSHGNGGKGYGISLQYSSTDCLIQDCIFRKMRHAIVLQSGANGNVIRANYALEGFWEDVKLPKYAAGDIVLHGNYPYYNYIEGNVCNQIVVDRSHGINGFNSILKNRLMKYGIFVQNKSVESILIERNDLVRSKCLEGKIRGKSKFIILNSNRKNDRFYRTHFEEEFNCKTFSIGQKAIYTIGYPCDFKNFYNVAFFRYNGSLISTYN